MVVIGITGGVGTGKSTVARIFGKLGAKVLDADRITHRLMRPHTDVWRRIRRRFGEGVTTLSGQIHRKRLSSRVFRDPNALRALCGIVHPAVRSEIRKRLTQIRRSDPDAVVVLDVPLLIEAKGAYRCDAIVVVAASRKQVFRRLAKRSGWTPAEIRRRQRFQMPLSRKIAQADFVVKNDGSIGSTRRQVIGIMKRWIKNKET